AWRAVARVRRFERPRLLASTLRRRSGPLSDWFFTSDLHGQGRLYEELVAWAAARHPRVGILGGAPPPPGGGADGAPLQRVFLEGALIEFARRLREASP